MNFDQAVEAIIKQALERGEFEDLPGKGKPIDLSSYFDTSEEVRAAYSLLKNAGMGPPEADLLREIVELRRILAAGLDERKKQEIQEQVQQKQVEFSLTMERHKRQRKQK